MANSSHAHHAAGTTSMHLLASTASTKADFTKADFTKADFTNVIFHF